MARKLLKFFIPPFLIFILSFLLPFTHWPEMMNWPFFIEKGWLPYRDFAMIHTPALPVLLLGFYKILGFTPLTLNIFGAMLLALTCLGVGIFTRSIFAQIAYIFLALAFEGNGVWFESLLAPILLLIFWCQRLIIEKPTRNKFILLGLLIGLGLITKQTFAYILPEFLLFFGFLAFKKRLKTKNILEVVLGTAVIISLFVFVLLKLGIVNDFWRWGVSFVFLKPFEGNGENAYALRPAIYQILIVFLLIATSFYKIFKNKKISNWLLLTLAVLSTLFALPRFGYFHLQPALMFVAVAIGFNSKKIFPTLIILVLSSFVFWNGLKYAHTFTDQDTLQISNYLTSNFPQNSLFSLNGPDQIYFLTNKLPAVKPWLPQLPWYLTYYGPQFLTDIKTYKPDVIIYNPYLDKPVNGLGLYQTPGVLNYVFDKYKLNNIFPNGIEILVKK